MNRPSDLHSLLMTGVGLRILGALALATLLGFAVVWALRG